MNTMTTTHIEIHRINFRVETYFVNGQPAFRKYDQEKREESPLGTFHTILCYPKGNHWEVRIIKSRCDDKVEFVNLKFKEFEDIDDYFTASPAVMYDLDI